MVNLVVLGSRAEGTFVMVKGGRWDKSVGFRKSGLDRRGRSRRRAGYGDHGVSGGWHGVVALPVDGLSKGLGTGSFQPFHVVQLVVDGRPVEKAEGEEAEATGASSQVSGHWAKSPSERVTGSPSRNPGPRMAADVKYQEFSRAA